MSLIQIKKPNAKIAIIGGGAAGLFVADSLNQDPSLDITLYEENNRLGGHAFTYPYQGQNGKTIPVDVGFIFFSHHYKTLSQKFNELGIKKRKADVDFSVSSDSFNVHLSPSLDNFFPNYFQKPLRPFAWDMLAKFTWENVAPTNENETIREYLDRKGYSKEFRELFLYPISSILWLIGPNDTDDVPANFLLNYYKNFGLMDLRRRTDWYTIEGGSKQYVQKISESFLDNILLSNKVTELHRTENSVRIVDVKNQHAEYDYVVMACPPNAAAQIIKAPTKHEVDILSAFTETSGTIYLHDDKNIIPNKPIEEYKPANIYYNPDGTMQVTFYMNSIVPELKDEGPFFVTLDGSRKPDPELIREKWVTAHPNFSRSDIQTREKIGEIQGINRVFYASGALGDGYHEQAALSGIHAAKLLREQIARDYAPV